MLITMVPKYSTPLYGGPLPTGSLPAILTQLTDTRGRVGRRDQNEAGLSDRYSRGALLSLAALTSPCQKLTCMINLSCIWLVIICAN